VKAPDVRIGCAPIGGAAVNNRLAERRGRSENAGIVWRQSSDGRFLLRASRSHRGGGASDHVGNPRDAGPFRGHVSCSFLALVLKKELEDRIAALAELAAEGAPPRLSWPDILADLDSLTETEGEQDGKRFLLRCAPRPAASLAVRAAGVALPPTLRQLADA